MTVAVEYYTIEEFMQSPGNGKRYELVKGELVEIPPVGEEHGGIKSNMHGYIWQYVQRQQLGKVYTSDTSFVIDAQNATVRQPDVAFVSRERVVRTTGAMPFPPDLAVEVVSLNDLWTEVDEKIEEYLQAGVRLIWVINPRRQVVYVYRQGVAGRQTLQLQDELDGENVLPGFRLRVNALFE